MKKRKVLINAHILGNEAVIDVFNPTESEKSYSFTVPAKEIGIDSDEIKSLTIIVPKAGYTLVKIKY